MPNSLVSGPDMLAALAKSHPTPGARPLSITVLTHFVFIRVCEATVTCYTDEETEAQKLSTLFPGNRDSDPRSPAHGLPYCCAAVSKSLDFSRCSFSTCKTELTTRPSQTPLKNECLPSCATYKQANVTLGKLLNLSELWFPYLIH